MSSYFSDEDAFFINLIEESAPKIHHLLALQGKNKDTEIYINNETNAYRRLFLTLHLGNFEFPLFHGKKHCEWLNLIVPEGLPMRPGIKSDKADIIEFNGATTTKYSLDIKDKDFVRESLKRSVCPEYDINCDGVFNAADAVKLQKLLLGEYDSSHINWKTADLCKDDILEATPHKACAEDAPTDFFVRLYRNSAGILSYVKGFLCKMTENMSADSVQSRQAGFVRCCLDMFDLCALKNRLITITK